ncbi:MAG: FtsW/RodA/SpoVE family cell cycle protein [Collinsella sp.]
MRYKYTFGIIGIILLMLPIFIGTTISGSKLWIRIAGFTIQPGEFAKVFIVLFLAGYLPRTASCSPSPTARSWALRSLACDCYCRCLPCGVCACSSSSSNATWVRPCCSTPSSC